MDFLALDAIRGYKIRMFLPGSQPRRSPVPRRAAALLLALVLNVTLVPCAMALQPAEDAHDCCPPETRLDAVDCCTLDDVTHDTRSARTWSDDDKGIELPLAPAFAAVAIPARGSGAEATGPPGHSFGVVPVYKLNCAYLK